MSHATSFPMKTSANDEPVHENTLSHMSSNVGINIAACIIEQASERSRELIPTKYSKELVRIAAFEEGNEFHSLASTNDKNIPINRECVHWDVLVTKKNMERIEKGVLKDLRLKSHLLMKKSNGLWVNYPGPALDTTDMQMCSTNDFVRRFQKSGYLHEEDNRHEQRLHLFYTSRTAYNQSRMAIVSKSFDTAKTKFMESMVKINQWEADMLTDSNVTHTVQKGSTLKTMAKKVLNAWEANTQINLPVKSAATEFPVRILNLNP